MKIYPRSAWTQRNPRNRVPLDFSKVEYIVDHWPGSKGHLDPSKTAQYLRGWQAMHMDVRGWTDIAYNEAVDQNGDVWICRGDFKDGATAGYGGRSYSILAVLGTLDTPSEAMLATLKLRNEKQQARGTVKTKVVGHRDLVQTECPGDKVYGWLRSQPVDPRLFPLPDGYYFGPKEGPVQSVSGFYHKLPNGQPGHPGLLGAQTQGASLGFFTGTPNGLYEASTKEFVVALQEAANKQGAGLGVDGLLGKGTWPWLWKVAPKPPVPPSNDVLFRAGSYNAQLKRFGGGDYSKDAAFVKDQLKVSVLAGQEMDEACRNLIVAANGYKTWAYKSMGIFWDPEKYDYGSRIELTLGTVYHGMIGTLLTSTVNEESFVLASVHVRPNDAISGSAAQKLAGKKADIKKIITKLKAYPRVVVAGDWSTREAKDLMIQAGYTLATPFEDTMDKGGVVDMVFIRGLEKRTDGVVVPTGASDHHGLVANLTLLGSLDGSM